MSTGLPGKPLLKLLHGLHGYFTAKDVLPPEEQAKRIDSRLIVLCSFQVLVAYAPLSGKTNEIYSGIIFLSRLNVFHHIVYGDVVQLQVERGDFLPVCSYQRVALVDYLLVLYFEAGGGGNSYESYTAAWYFGLNHCRLDCWKRGKKGIIITMGDEPLNPYLPIRGMCCGLADVTGDNLQADVNTKDLYEDVIKKYDVYHLAVDDMATSYRLYAERIEKSFGEYLDKEHLRVVNLNTIANTIVDIVCNSDKDVSSNARLNNENGMISW